MTYTASLIACLAGGTRIVRALLVPMVLCGCLSFCVTDMGDRLDVLTADPRAFAIIHF